MLHVLMGVQDVCPLKQARTTTGAKMNAVMNKLVSLHFLGIS